MQAGIWSENEYISAGPNKRVPQMRALLAAGREPAGEQNRSPKMPYVFNIKQDIL